MTTKTFNQADYNGVQIVTDNGDNTGQMRVDIVSTATSTASASTTSNVASAAADTLLLAANANRKGASIFNDADKALFVKFGAAPSATSFKVKIAAGGYYDFPLPIYTGVVRGIWEAAPTGSARIAEET